LVQLFLEGGPPGYCTESKTRALDAGLADSAMHQGKRSSLLHRMEPCTQRSNTYNYILVMLYLVCIQKYMPDQHPVRKFKKVLHAYIIKIKKITYLRQPK
jgi:hypothetical protein